MTSPAPVHVGFAGCKSLDLLGDETTVECLTRGLNLTLARAAGGFRFRENTPVGDADCRRSVQRPGLRGLTARQPHLSRTLPLSLKKSTIGRRAMVKRGSTGKPFSA